MLYCSDILTLCLAFREHGNDKEEYTDLWGVGFFSPGILS